MSEAARSVTFSPVSAVELPNAFVLSDVGYKTFSTSAELFFAATQPFSPSASLQATSPEM